MIIFVVDIGGFTALRNIPDFSGPTNQSTFRVQPRPFEKGFFEPVRVPEEGSPEAEENEREIDSSDHGEQFDSFGSVVEDLFDLDATTGPPPADDEFEKLMADLRTELRSSGGISDSRSTPAPKSELTFAEAQRRLKELAACFKTPDPDPLLQAREIAEGMDDVFDELYKSLTSGIPISVKKREEVKFRAAVLVFWLVALANELEFDLGETVEKEQDLLLDFFF